jgi:hypothetical protein
MLAWALMTCAQCQMPCFPNVAAYTCAPSFVGLKCEFCDAAVQCSGNGVCAGAFPQAPTVVNSTDLTCRCVIDRLTQRTLLDLGTLGHPLITSISSGHITRR